MMEDTAKQIRNELAKLGYSNRDVSVRMASGYTIRVNSKKDIPNLRKIVKDVYWSEEHSWLCVCVDGHWLPMPPVKCEGVKG